MKPLLVMLVMLALLFALQVSAALPASAQAKIEKTFTEAKKKCSPSSVRKKSSWPPQSNPCPGKNLNADQTSPLPAPCSLFTPDWPAIPRLRLAMWINHLPRRCIVGSVSRKNLGSLTT